MKLFDQATAIGRVFGGAAWFLALVVVFFVGVIVGQVIMAGVLR
jgi:hypothetical protein